MAQKETLPTSSISLRDEVRAKLPLTSRLLEQNINFLRDPLILNETVFVQQPNLLRVHPLVHFPVDLDPDKLWLLLT